jgi:hypothetical protein
MRAAIIYGALAPASGWRRSGMSSSSAVEKIVQNRPRSLDCPLSSPVGKRVHAIGGVAVLRKQQRAGATGAAGAQHEFLRYQCSPRKRRRSWQPRGRRYPLSATGGHRGRERLGAPISALRKPRPPRVSMPAIASVTVRGRTRKASSSPRMSTISTASTISSAARPHSPSAAPWSLGSATPPFGTTL